MGLVERGEIGEDDLKLGTEPRLVDVLDDFRGDGLGQATAHLRDGCHALFLDSDGRRVGRGHDDLLACRGKADFQTARERRQHRADREVDKQHEAVDLKRRVDFEHHGAPLDDEPAGLQEFRRADERPERRGLHDQSQKPGEGRQHAPNGLGQEDETVYLPAPQAQGAAGVRLPAGHAWIPPCTISAAFAPPQRDNPSATAGNGWSGTPMNGAPKKIVKIVTMSGMSRNVSTYSATRIRRKRAGKVASTPSTTPMTVDATRVKNASDSVVAPEPKQRQVFDDERHRRNGA